LNDPIEKQRSDEIKNRFIKKQLEEPQPKLKAFQNLNAMRRATHRLKLTSAQSQRAVDVDSVVGSLLDLLELGKSKVPISSSSGVVDPIDYKILTYSVRSTTTSVAHLLSIPRPEAKEKLRYCQ